MLKAIHLINCQSLRDVRYELATDRVNVIQADNNVGKSVLFKMLKITASPKYYSPAERKELIRWGEDIALISFILDTGEVYSTVVQPTKVFYAYQEYEGAEMTIVDHWTSEELQKIGLLVNDQYIANVLDAEQDLILVNSNLKSNFSLVQLLVCDNGLEKLKETIKAEIQNCHAFESQLSKKMIQYDTLVSSGQYVDVSDMQQVYDSVSVACNLLDKMINLSDVEDSINLENQTYLDITKELDVLQKLGRLRSVQIQESVSIPKEELLTVLEKIHSIPQISHVEQPPKPEGFEVLSKVNTIKSLVNSIKDISSLEQDMNDKYYELCNSSTCINCEKFGKVLLCNDKCIHID